MLFCQIEKFQLEIPAKIVKILRFLFYRCEMKKFLFCFAAILVLASCSGNETVESKWRVINEEKYEPKIDESQLYTSLDELEKLIVAPVSYFRDKNGIYSFSQSVDYGTVSVIKTASEEGENEKTTERKLSLHETSKFRSDKNGNFSMSYQNNKNEGWDIVWRNNFFYRKQFGGEFTKTFSMGEHITLRDNLFGTIPSIYLMLRDHASIESEKAWKVGTFKGHLVTIVFSDKKTDRAALPEKKYLQNLQGTEEMRDDSLIAGLSGKKKDAIKGKMTVFVSLEGAVAEMKIEDLSFRFTDEDVTFTINGVRTLSTDSAETILEPEYNEEYHRRTLDSSVNIMKKKEDKKEEKHDEE